jgi:hypothetical protein
MTDSDADSPSQHEEGFLSRWSRRKHVAKAGNAEKPLQESIEDSQDDPLLAKAPAEESAEIAAVEEDFPADSDMPPLESLDNDSDYSGFMSPKVSDELRNLALRKLFLGGMFNARDGLDDYDDDFTSFEKLGDIITADMRHQMEMAKEALAASDAAEEELVEEDESLLEAESVVMDEAADVEQKADSAVPAAEQGSEKNRVADSRHAYENEPYIENRNADHDK